MFFRTQHQDIRLNTYTLQFFYRMLRRFCLYLLSGFQIGDICQMYTHSSVSQFPFELSYCFEKRRRLNVSYSTSDFSDYKIIAMLTTKLFHVAFDFVCDVRYNLNCLSKIITSTFLIYYCFIDSSCCERVCSCCMYICKSFVMSEVKVCFCSIDSHIALSMFTRI